jgi:hypothetical protein
MWLSKTHDKGITIYHYRMLNISPWAALWCRHLSWWPTLWFSLQRGTRLWEFRVWIAWYLTKASKRSTGCEKFVWKSISVDYPSRLAKHFDRQQVDFWIQKKKERMLFIIIIWFVRLLALRPLLAYCASLGWYWRWLWRNRWNVDWQGNRSSRRKPAPVPLLSITKSHMTRPRFEPGPPLWEAGD